MLVFDGRKGLHHDQPTTTRDRRGGPLPPPLYQPLTRDTPKSPKYCIPSYTPLRPLRRYAVTPLRSCALRALNLRSA